jgi:hypothetical protein
VDFVHDFLLNFFYFVDHCLDQPFTFMLSSVDLAVWPLDPADGRCKISCHSVMLTILDEGDDIADVFLVANLFVLSILINT